MNTITIYAFDKDSSSVFSRSFTIDKTFKKAFAEFEDDVPFSRFYYDVEDEDLTDKQVKIIRAASDCLLDN